MNEGFGKLETKGEFWFVSTASVVSFYFDVSEF